MPEHVHRGAGLLQRDVAHQWFVLTVFIGLHVEKEHLGDDGPERLTLLQVVSR